jgi:hypothetical protein
LFYLGKRHQAFADAFADWGEIVRLIANSRKEYQREYMRKYRLKSAVVGSFAD